MIMEKNVLQFEKRKKIFDYIEKNPGLYAREISRNLDIPLTSLLYHLRFLKKLDLIRGKNDGKYIRFFIKHMVGLKEKQLIGLLRNDNSCKILLHLIWSFACSQIELSKELEIPPPTVSYYLKKLTEMGIIEKAPVKNGLIYPFKNNRRIIIRKPVKSEKFYRRTSQEYADLTYKILITHKSSLINKNLIGYYLDMYNTVKSNPYSFNVKKIKKMGDAMNSVIDVFNSFFPPPFCA